MTASKLRVDGSCREAAASVSQSSVLKRMFALGKGVGLDLALRDGECVGRLLVRF